MSLRLASAIGIILSTCIPTLSHVAMAEGAKPLVVGIREQAPFAIKNPDGSWSGITTDIWQRVASELKIPFEFREAAIDQLNTPVESGLDVVPGFALSKYSEERMDVSSPFLFSGLAIATRIEQADGFQAVLSKVTSGGFLKNFGILLAVMFGMGTVVWFIERGANTATFGGSPIKGIAAGFVWTIEALFGKGKSLSGTPAARVFAIAWTAVCVLLISSVTAGISAELTVNKLANSVNGPNDLPKVRVGGPKRPSVASAYLDQRGISFRSYESTALALEGLANREIDAVVADDILLRYITASKYATTVTVLPGTFKNGATGLALKPGNPLRKEINLAVLRIAESDEWQATVAKYIQEASVAAKSVSH